MLSSPFSCMHRFIGNSACQSLDFPPTIPGNASGDRLGLIAVRVPLQRHGPPRFNAFVIESFTRVGTEARMFWASMLVAGWGFGNCAR